MSGFTIQTEEAPSMTMYEVKERLCLTEDDKLVPEDHPDARWLYATPGQEIPMEQAEKYGLVKAKAKTADKQRAKGEDKSA